MKINKKICKIATSFILILSILTILSCGDDDDQSNNNTNNNNNTNSGIGYINYAPSNCTSDGQNEFVYKIMTDTYFWYDMVQEANISSYNSPEELLKDLRYEELDKWSYITSKDEYYNYYEEGKYIGMGYYRKYDSDRNLRIAFVYKNSPAHIAGLKRGDIILEINSKSIQDIDNNDLWDTIYGEDEEGVMVDLKIEDTDGIRKELNLTKTWVKINAVLYYNILKSNGQKIAYLAFNNFIETASAELEEAFAYFKEQEVDELILDLRYNGGGRVHISRDLASLIAGVNADNDSVFKKYIHNDKYKHWDRKRYFRSMQNALSLNRVFVITSKSTCSASETLINGLNPFIDVVLIGNTTCGKPVGMYGHDFCDQHISPIEFTGNNADGEGGYFDGISTTCTAEDDLLSAMGDPQEVSLKQSLYYIANNYCDPDINERTRSRTKQKEIELKGFRREIGAF